MSLGELVERTLARLGIVSPHSRDDEINARTEDALRSYEHAANALRQAIANHEKGNNALRESIRIAKTRTNSFADFERMAVRKEELK